MSHLHSPYQQLLSSGYTGASSVLAEAMDTVYQQADKSEPVLSSYLSGYTASNGSAYWGAVYSPKQDKLWFIPHQNSVSKVWHYMDCRTQKVAAYAHGTSGIHVTDAAYAGGSWDPGTDRIYMHPMAQTTTLHYIDCASGAVVAYKGFSGLPVRYSVGGGAYDPVNQRVWLPPAVGSTGTHWPYIDTRTATTGWYPHGTTGLASNSNSYSGAVYSPASRKVFFLPLWQVRSDLYHYIDCDTLKVCAYSSGASGALSGSTGSSFVGGVYDSYHDRVYLMPFNAKGNYLYIDCRTNKVVSYAGASGVVNCDYAHGGCYSPLTRRIYLSYRNAPAYGATGTWSYIDTEANKLVTYKGSSSIVASLASSGTFVPSLNRVYFTPYGGAAVSPWYYVQESAPRTPALLPYAMGAAPAQGLSLICLDEAEVSMLCVDGSDGKGGVFQLHTVYSDRQEHNGWCSWQSSDPSVATVSSTGLVTAVSNGGAALGKDVTITASYGGLSYSCLFTVYQTMPSETVRYGLKGGSGPEMGSSVSTPTVVFNSAGSTVVFDQITYGNELNSVTNGEVPRMSLPYCRSIIHSAVPTYMTNWQAITPAWVYSPGYYTAHLMLLAWHSVYGKRLAFKRFYTATSGYGHETYAACYTTETSVNFDGALTADTGATINDEEYVNQWNASGSLSRSAGLALLFYQQTRKFVHQSWSRTKPTMDQLLDPGFCELYYTPQNYILYRNRTAGGVLRSNYTVIPNIGTLGSAYDLSANNVPAGWFASNAPEFLCVDEAEVSMLCVDGTDGKDGEYQLHAVFTGDVSSNAWVTWSSSDHSVATVSSSGLVTAVSNGGAALGKDVTITATYEGKTSSCLFTVYQTMPSATVEGEGLWLCKGGRGSASFRSGLNLTAPLASTSLDIIMLSSTQDRRSTWYVANDMPEGSASTGLLSGFFDLIWANSSSSHCRFRCGNFLVSSSVGKRITMEFLSATQEDYNACGSYMVPSSANCRVLRNGVPGTILTGGRAASYNNVPAPLAWDTWDVSLSCRFSGSIGRNLSEFYELSLPARCDAFYYAQNYIRYADRTTPNGTVRSNYTVIPNIGTLGSAYDLAANSVPSSWFGV